MADKKKKAATPKPRPKTKYTKEEVTESIRRDNAGVRGVRANPHKTRRWI